MQIEEVGTAHRFKWSFERGVSVTVSMRVMSAGHGYRYLLSSVAVGDGQRRAGQPLTAYYTAEGTPPGRWLGTGLAGLGEGSIREGDVVEESQLSALLGEGRDPMTGSPLGRAYPKYTGHAERIAARTTQLDPGLGEEERAAAVTEIESEEASRRQRRAVAGYDLTFSVPKSVSVLWALAPAEVQAQIVDARHAAISDVIGLFESEVAATRVGVDAGDGAVAQVEVNGVSAVGFDHWDSRAGDPQLHTHVVVANKARTVLDGKWRSLDGRPIHAAMVAISEHYRAILADRLARDLGVTWHQHERGADRNPGWDIAGVPDALLGLFSSRSDAIDHEKDRLIDEYVATHGHQPTRRTIIRLRQQATLSTRPTKTTRPLRELMQDWRTRATQLLGRPAAQWATDCLGHARRPQQLLTADAVSKRTVAGIAAQVVEVVGDRRSTWRRWNLHAEASRQLAGVRFATTADRMIVLDKLVMAAEAASIRLTPPDLAPVPAELRRADGTSVLRPRHATVYTSADLLAAEDRLLELGRTTTAPTVPVITVAQIAASAGLDADQEAAVAAVARSGRTVDVLIGPAGAGKTTAMHTLHQAWTRLYGQTSVLGLAPSAATAQVLADDLGVTTENTAKWLHDHRAGTTRLTAGQLVIIDEASLAGTRTLHAIAQHASEVGAKVLLVGDPAQLGAVSAGRALQLLAQDRDDIAELTDIRRFHHSWEATATLQLRHGHPAVLDTYDRNGRLHQGDTDTVLDAAYTAWQADLGSGRSNLLIAPTRDAVTALNQRAQADRITAGRVDAAESVPLRDGTSAGRGEVIVTRRNNRRLHGPGGWVRNGDRWIITATHADGALDVQRDGRPTSRPFRLPAQYVVEHVELGYAVTAHRAQGATVDTAHAVVTPGMTRETLYVAMSRGRHANHAYTSTDTPPDTEPHHDHDGGDGQKVLESVLARTGAEESAHHVVRAEQDRWGGIAQLAAEYDTIAATAQRPRWTALIQNSGLTPDQAASVIASDAFGPLTAALRRAESHHISPEHLLPQLVAARPLDGASNIAAVLHHRLGAVLRRRPRGSRSGTAPRLVGGLFPQATGPMPDEMRDALDERQRVIQRRAVQLAQTAVANGDSWTRALGPPPADPQRRSTWLTCLATLAAYRERYRISGTNLLSTSGKRKPNDHEFTAANAALHRALGTSPPSTNRRLVRHED